MTIPQSLQTITKITNSEDLYDPRRIVFILGNGFDIDLQLPTRYEDFWKSDFCPKDYPAPLIRHLNKCWGNKADEVRWYDLENELRSYYQIIKKTSRERRDIVSEEEANFIKRTDPNFISANSFTAEEIRIIHSLSAKGLFEQVCTDGYVHYVIPYHEDLKHDAVWRDREAFNRIKKGLCDYLCTIEADKINKDCTAASLCDIIAQLRKHGDIVSVYTFNYTRFLINDDPKYAKNTSHVHGCCSEKNIIIGTKDDWSYDKDYDFLQKSFDPHFYPPAIVPALLSATDVIFFGHSIGDNDRQYFKSFFKQQTSSGKNNRINITIFTYDDDSELEIKRALQTMTDSNLSVLYSQNNVKIIKTKSLRSNPKDYLDFVSKYFSKKKPLDLLGNIFLKSLSIATSMLPIARI